MKSFWMALTAVALFGQVKVDLRTNQATYLAGEPVFVVVDVTNIGTEPVGYSACDGHADLTVDGGRKKQSPNLFGCFAGFGGGSGCGIDHPPLMKPGQTVSFWYLLKGYNLPAGDYTLQAAGKAGVRWKYYPRAGGSVPRHSETEPVEGQMFNRSMKLVVEDATEAKLRERYASYVADAEGWDRERRPRAREAIAEMAPTFLEKTLLGFANQPEDAHLAVEGLGQISTAESRHDLIALFDASADLRVRAYIVEKLAGIGTPGEISFFSSLLAGRSSALDDPIRIFAALGLGRIDGEESVKVLESAPRNPNPEVRASVATALGNTKDPDAIPALIRMYADETARVQDSVCSAFVTLTHYQWCHGSGSGEMVQARWRAWWQSHSARLTLYDAGQCPEPGIPLPAVK
jgi:hypothetical protein